MSEHGLSFGLQACHNWSQLLLKPLPEPWLSVEGKRQEDWAGVMLEETNHATV